MTMVTEGKPQRTEPSTPLRVLIVEDQEADAELMLRELRREGFAPEHRRVETQAELQQALESTQWHVVLADFSLPKFSGLEALTVVRAAQPDIPFILVTGTLGEEKAVATVKAGVDDYILKDNLRRLGPAVARELREAAARKRHRESQEALRVSVARYRDLVEGSIEAIMVFQERRPVFVNPAAVRMFGFNAAEEMLALKDFEAFQAPEERERLRELTAARLRGEPTPERYELKMLHRNGTPVWVEVLARRVEWEGRLANQVTLIDVTQRKTAEGAARLAGERLEAAMDGMWCGFWLFDPDERLVLWNEQVLSMFESIRDQFHAGMTFEELIRAGVGTVVTPTEDVEAYVQRRLDEFRDPQGRGIEVQLNDGHWLLLRDRRMANGGTVCLRIDITAQKNAQGELRRQQWLLQSAFDELPLMVYVLDESLRFQVVNRRMAQAQGMAPEQVLGLRHHDLALIPEPSRTWLHDQSALALQSGKPSRHLDVVIGERGGTPRTFEIWFMPLTSSHGNERLVLVVAHEITDRKLLERQLSTSQRMESIGRLAGGIAHDFNNMLAVMSSYGELALDQLVADHPARNDIQTILDATGRAAALTRQLLAFSRRQLLEMKVLDLNRIVSNLEKMLQRVIGEDINLRTKLGARLGSIRADESQIEQIIMNLTVNARDAMPTGGTLTMETARTHLDENYVKSHLEVIPGDYVMLAVTDTGTGMDEETQRRIFEPFFTTKPVGKGTGLGLSTVYGIVKQMAGLVYVYSELGKGTCFKVYFPLVESTTRQEVLAAEKPDHPRGNETILLVEDDEQVREAARRILASGGYQVLAARNGRHALELAQANQGRIDLLVSDVIMPGMSGKEVSDGVRQFGLSRVLFMSGYTDDSIVNHGILEGSYPFLHKPFSKDAMLSKVREVLHSPPAVRP